jgi:hypothetical protein
VDSNLYNDTNAKKYLKAIICSYEFYKKKIADIQSKFYDINLNTMYNPIYDSINKAKETYNKQIEQFQNTYENNGNVLSFLNCKYLYYDLNIIYYTLTELASKTRSLCGITTSLAFFLAIAVYATIWAMHHYDNELFNGKKKKRRKSKNFSSNHNHSSKTKIYSNDEKKYVNNINENDSLSKSKTVKTDNHSKKKKKILNETELSIQKNNEEDSKSLKENMLDSIN